MLAAGARHLPSRLKRLPARLLAGRLSRNALFALAQGVVATLIVFLIYRLVLLHAGLERFGVWSLLMAAAAVARLADVSGGGALARFVAAAARDPDPHAGRDTVHTVLATGLALNAGLGALLWLAAPLLLPLFVADEHLADARALVPWAIAVNVLTALAYATISAIDGAQRADHRALVVMTAALGFLGASWVLVPRYGILGFAVAQTLQQAATLALGWMVLRRHVPGLGWGPRRWRRDLCAETTGYALRLNGVGMMALLFEPLFAFNHAGAPGLAFCSIGPAPGDPAAVDARSRRRPGPGLRCLPRSRRRAIPQHAGEGDPPPRWPRWACRHRPRRGGEPHPLTGGSSLSP
jgi:hypothetical protein